MFSIMNIFKITAMLMLGVALCSCGNRTESSGCISVADHGARGNGAADDTAAIRSAISSASEGGIVFFPSGLYRVSEPITVPAGISLVGVTAATCGPWQNIMDAADKGTAFLGGDLSEHLRDPDFYRGSWILSANTGEDATFTLQGGNTVSMLGFVNDTMTPMSPDGGDGAPPLIGIVTDRLTRTDGITVSDISLANCDIGISVRSEGQKAAPAGGIVIRNIMGSPLGTGIYLSGVSDRVTVENLQFNYAIYSGEYVARRHSYARDVVIGNCADVHIDGMLSFGARTGLETRSISGGTVGLTARNLNLESMRPLVLGARGEQKISNSYMLTVDFAGYCAEKNFALITVTDDDGSDAAAVYELSNIVLQDSIISTSVTDLVLDAVTGKNTRINLTGLTVWGFNPGTDEPIFRYLHNSGEGAELTVTNLAITSALKGCLAEVGGDAYTDGEVCFRCCRIPDTLELPPESSVIYDACAVYSVGGRNRELSDG